MESKLHQAFLLELAKYYMEFLENDFKANRPPRRRLSDDSFRINIREYEKYGQQVMAFFQQNGKGGEMPPIKPEENIITLSTEEVRKINNAEDGDVKEVVQSILQSKRVQDITSALTDILEAREKKGKSFTSWLKGYILDSLHYEVRDMLRHKEMLDQQEIYLYFMTICDEANVYPLFYLPLQVEKQEDGAYEVIGDPVLLIHQKAIRYLSEKHEKGQPNLPPRHVYLSQFENYGDLLRYLQSIVNEICEHFKILKIDITKPEQKIRGNKGISIRNEMYLALADKSDEYLLNDYEELITLIQKGEENEAYSIFSKIVRSFLYENPISVEREVETLYEKLSVSQKFSYYSPIPLNKEQQQVLSALRDDKCERIVIEGPPGTGKSHTIAAIIYDALLRNQSVLMVSDKKEALDVVEEKINDVLNTVKVDEFVQNPVLRLGKQNNNFTKIFSQLNLGKIKTRHSAYQKEKQRIETETQGILRKIEKDINEEVVSSEMLQLKDIETLIKYEKIYTSKWAPYLAEEEQNIEALSALYNGIRKFHEQYSYLAKERKITLPIQKDMQKDIEALKESLEEICLLKKEKVGTLQLGKSIKVGKIETLERILRKMEEIRKPLIGYWLAGKKIKALERELNENFYAASISSLKTQRTALENECLFYKYCKDKQEKMNRYGLDLFYLFNEDAIEQTISDLDELLGCLKAYEDAANQLPKTLQQLGIRENNEEAIFKNPLASASEEEMKQLIDYLGALVKMKAASEAMLRSELPQDRKSLEERLVLKMTNILDEKVITFRETYRNDASQIRQQFKAKKQISKEQLKKLVMAFPCLIVGIRELGEFIPLEPQLFDVVIIDEASQVSIAQAFPAVLRAKKVVVLGDSKQFGNVKSHNAAKEVNQQLFSRVRQSFQSDDPTLMLKVDNFNIKKSVLEFMKNISNYHCVLKKHFRGYLELIDYSNHYFYDKSLEVMKIRSKPIHDVIRFKQVKPKSLHKNVNEAEADYILSQISDLKQRGYSGTVGIITPYREQQKWISKKLFEHVDWQHFQEVFKVKVMTFDSCQGEERDIIYYSLVEKEGEDTLKYIFPVEMQTNEDNLKAQRLNVGFSRVKEQAVFVVSKPVKNFEGEIGKALRHFHNHLQAKNHKEILEAVDPNSPMEKYLYQLVIQTPFYKRHQKQIEIIPQFEMGEYIKQLDPTATIPKYRVDFLVIFGNKTVILEYDGFEFHFSNNDRINKWNYQHFYTASDIERQKTIESYGYPFIRMNKFIMRNDPIEFLDEQFQKHFGAVAAIKDSLAEEVVATYKKIESKEMKVCQKCGKPKDLEEFFDSRLKSGYGRLCIECKTKKPVA